MSLFALKDRNVSNCQKCQKVAAGSLSQHEMTKTDTETTNTDTDTTTDTETTITETTTTETTTTSYPQLCHHLLPQPGTKPPQPYQKNHHSRVPKPPQTGTEPPHHCTDFGNHHTTVPSLVTTTVPGV